MFEQELEGMTATVFFEHKDVSVLDQAGVAVRDEIGGAQDLAAGQVEVAQAEGNALAQPLHPPHHRHIPARRKVGCRFDIAFGGF